MKIQLTSIAKGDKCLFVNEEAAKTYFGMHEGQRLIHTIVLESDMSAKQKLYAYFHSTVLSCAIIGFERQDGEIIDEAVAKWRLKCQLLKTHYQEGGKTKVRVQDLDELSAFATWKFVLAAIQFIETDLEVSVPESSEYKNMKIAERKGGKTQGSTTK